MPHHRELLDLHTDRQYKPPIRQAGEAGVGGGGGGDDKGHDSDFSDFDDDEEGEDPYDTDKTDKDYNVTPPNSDKEKWEKSLLKKRSQRKACKQWDIIRIVWDGLLHCYEMQVSHLREHHLRTRNKARRITQAMAELKKGNILEEEVRYMLDAFTCSTELTNPP